MEIKNSNMYTVERHIEGASKSEDFEIIPSNVICFNQEEVDALKDILAKQDIELFETRFSHCGVEVVCWEEDGELSLTINNSDRTVDITVYYKVVDLKILED